jgi:hypothetical protein
MKISNSQIFPRIQVLTVVLLRIQVFRLGEWLSPKFEGSRYHPKAGSFPTNGTPSHTRKPAS